eukprot:8143784-Alexandrium_andersonii.AAC.1
MPSPSAPSAGRGFRSAPRHPEAQSIGHHRTATQLARHAHRAAASVTRACMLGALPESLPVSRMSPTLPRMHA